MSAHLRLVEPSNVNRSVPVRPKKWRATEPRISHANRDREADQGGPDGRYGDRDATLILIAFRHGLRASEICDLEWTQVEFGRSARCMFGVSRMASRPCIRFAVTRSAPYVNFTARPMASFVFATERGGPFTTDAVNRLLKRIAERARFPAGHVHFHMLRHACGYALANAGHDTRRLQDWLGHKSIQHTVRYTELSTAPFRDFWRD